MNREMEVYRNIAAIPSGTAKRDKFIDGCLVLEGGGWRGLYTTGVIDAFMEAGIAFRTTIGVSAGALNGIGYNAGQIGWTARIDLTFRNDPRYVGRGALIHEHGFMGLHYLFRDILKEYPMDKKRFLNDEMELVVQATNLETGKPEYFAKKTYPNIIGATIASASVPYVSRPIRLDGRPYLDGGCSDKIPYPWAVRQGFDKIVVVRTRNREYRRECKPLSPLAKIEYRKYPEFLKSLDFVEERYNEMCDRLESEEVVGKIFVIAPSGPVTVGRFEKDLDKLGDLYFQGYRDGRENVPAMLAYLKKNVS